MKFLVKIVLLVFTLFLATPTIVSLIKSDCETLQFYNFAEEEEIHKEIKEVNEVIKSEFSISLFYDKNKSTAIKSKNLQRHENASGDIFSPPPELI